VVILGCAIAAGHLLATVERADGSTAFDASITNWIVDHRADALTTLARALSTIGSQKVLTPLAVVLGGALLLRRQLVLAGLLLLAWAGALGLYSLAKLAVERPRPPSDIWLTHVGKTTSFPSGHATQSLGTYAALAVVAAALVPRARLPAAALALVIAAGVGWSRVYLGVHWTTDVLAGWLTGAAWVIAVVVIARRVEPVSGDRRPERSPGRTA
jgi:undecaprenyl-diphosphatase